MSVDSKEIEWTPDFSIKPENFLGIVDDSDPHDARTRAGVNYFFEHSVEENKKRYKIKIENIWVRAYFLPHGSWIREKILGEINLPKLLKHEQGHFDLAERSARRFERKLKNKFQNKTFSYNKNLVSDPVAEIRHSIQMEFEILNKEVEQGHRNYDKLTNHGLISKEQEKFDTRFAQLRN